MGSVSGRVNVHTGPKDHTDVTLRAYLHDASWNEIFAANATAALQLSAPANGTCSIAAHVDTPIVEVSGSVDYADQWYSVQASGVGVEFAQVFTIPSIVPNLCIFPPTSAAPTLAPTLKPVAAPSLHPSAQPTAPSVKPSLQPSRAPNAPLEPSVPPTKAPTSVPSLKPSVSPSITPSKAPSNAPTIKPTPSPSNAPSMVPSASPSITPSLRPTRAPTIRPTSNPSTGKGTHF